MAIEKNLEHYLMQQTPALRKDIAAECTLAGKDCFLYVPANPAKKVCVVAHIDTVHPEDYAIKELIHDNGKGSIWSPQGLGADDRAGVWAGLHLFHTMHPDFQPYLLLCDKEEKGGVGAREAAEMFKDVLRSESITYFIEMDRANSQDSVFYCGEPEAFKDYVNAFGFVQARGTFSDVAVLGPAAQKCTVNLSTGYYYQHTKREILVVSELMDTLWKVKNMIVDNALQQRMWLN